MSNSHLEKVISLASKDSEKGARVVAKLFYRALRKNGFTENQVINIATNILNCLTESLKGYEKKLENKKKTEPADEMQIPFHQKPCGRQHDIYM